MKTHFFKYILALFLFGLNGVVASHITLNSTEIVYTRTMIGSLFLLFIFLLGKKQFTFFHHKKSLLFLIFSGIAMGTSWLFLYQAYKEIGVSIASLTYYCGPMIVIILSPLLFKEKLTRRKLLAFLIVLLGIFLVNGQVLQLKHNSFGIFCGLLSAVMYAFMVICNKKASDITGLENSTLQLIVSFLTVALFIGIQKGFLISVPANNWIFILILGILNTGIGCYLYFSSISHLSVQTVAICGYLEPLSAVLFAVLLLHESMSTPQFLGGCMILGGTFISEKVN